MNLETINCLLCGAAEYVVLFDGKDREHPLPGTFPVVRCAQCGLVYLNPRPDEASLPECYPDEYDAYAYGVGLVGRLQKVTRRLAARRIAARLPGGGRVLEVGCATGDLLVPLRDVAGMEVCGVELSPYAAAIARDRFDLEVKVGKLSDFSFGPGTFDAVVMRNVLEHLPDPLGDLKRAAAVLSEGGHVFIEVPNHDSLDRRLFGKYWYSYSTPRHLSLPSVATLSRMLAKAGFRVVSVRHSMLPNNWIGSVKNLLEEFFGRRPSLQKITFKNPICVLLAMPLGVVQKVLRRSGRIEVVAEKIRVD